MTYYETGSTEADLSADDLKQGMVMALENIGEKHRVLMIPPDYTRLPSRSGELTEYCWECSPNAFGNAEVVGSVIDWDFVVSGPRHETSLGGVFVGKNGSLRLML